MAERIWLRASCGKVWYLEPPKAVASPPLAWYFASMKAAAFSMYSRVAR